MPPDNFIYTKASVLDVPLCGGEGLGNYNEVICLPLFDCCTSRLAGRQSEVATACSKRHVQPFTVVVVSVSAATRVSMQIS